MTTLFGKKTGYYIQEVPDDYIDTDSDSSIIKNNGYEYAILYYGNILKPEEWKTLEVPISSIKSLRPSSNGYDKIEVIWDEDEEYNIDMFNKIEFK